MLTGRRNRPGKNQQRLARIIPLEAVLVNYWLKVPLSRSKAGKSAKTPVFC
jgi:hypothetical protein